MTISTTTLKNSARAIGYDLWSDPDGSHYLVDYDGVKLKRWDPEHSSADSFELMVLLGMEINRVACMSKTICWFNRNECSVVFDYECGGDQLLTTRISILKSAARIGSAL